MFLTEEALYPIVYDSACERMADGVTREEIEAEVMLLTDTPDLDFTRIIRQAYADVLAGRPSRFPSPLSR
jgi:hypothetical protein